MLVSVRVFVFSVCVEISFTMSVFVFLAVSTLCDDDEDDFFDA